MNKYIIKCFVKEPSAELKEVLKELVLGDLFTIEKGWENGHHLVLKGLLNENTLDSYILKLENAIKSSNFIYSKELFRNEYRIINKLLYPNKSCLSEIFQGEVKYKKVEYFLNNDDEDKLFIQINNIFDTYYYENYFSSNDIYKLIEEAWKFHSFLQKYVNNGLFDAFNCHLSHYIAFQTKLVIEDSNKINEIFHNKYQQGLLEGRFNFNKHPSQLTKNLEPFYNNTKRMVISKKINFFSPYDLSYLEEKIKYASKSHQRTFSEKYIHEFLYNDVLITNRWFTNCLYAKMLLLNFSNLDRFFMNYVISRNEYSHEELINMK